eukprot:symbB.v1.2.025430.t1/scaffold2465.1/size78641/6
MSVQRADGFIIQTGDPGPEKGGGFQPTPVGIRGRPETLYGETVDEARLVGQEVKIPFQADGTVALARREFDNDTASSQVFFFLFESEFGILHTLRRYTCLAGSLGMAMALTCKLLVFFALQKASAFDIDGCTSIIVNADAMEDGSAVASHANDCADCDWRVAYVPAKDHPEGSATLLNVMMVDPSRSKSYQPALGITSSKILGRIPQAIGRTSEKMVKHTYALWEASYSLMNEHGLGLGESTCSAFLVGTGISQGGTALFSIGNLMAIALERCKTARCAIQTMGDLGAKYGFFGEDPGMGGAGEAVTLVDKTGEAWVFHICGGVPSTQPNASWANQRGALWAAQRVPSGHVAVVANSMIIREVDIHDKENFMVHPGLVDLLQEAKLWDGNGALDWQKVVAPDMQTFSYFPGLAPIPMYSTLRP